MNNESGSIYLIQPAELVGTNRYKIGCSKKNDLERCKKGYKKGTRFINIQECKEPFVIEQEVKKHFSDKFKLIAGKEYFEGNEDEIKKEFNDIITKFTLLKSDDNDTNTNTDDTDNDTNTDTDDTDDTDNNYNNDNDIYFKFKSQGVSINPVLLKSKALFNPPYINSPDIKQDLFKINLSNLNKYEINCRDNFNEEEISIIKTYNIKSLDDLLRCTNITSIDKTRALKCYKYVYDRNKLMGIEPFNGNICIQFEKYLFNIRISFNKTITFIQSLGIKKFDDFYTIQMVS